MSHQEVRVGIIVVIENLSLEMDILLLHLLMIVVTGLVYLTEMQTEVGYQAHILHLTGVFVPVVQVQLDGLVRVLWMILD
jgi:hypothetical protein